MKKIVLILIFLLIFAFPACAQDSVYKESYDAVGAGELEQTLDESVRSFFEQTGIDPSDYGWTQKLTEKGFVSHFFSLLSGGISAPLKAGVYIISVVLICASFSAFSPENSATAAALFAAVLAVCALVAGDIWQSISSACAAIKSCSSFMLAFIPIFAAAVSLSGAPVTSAAMSALLLAAAEGVAGISSFIVMPLLGGYTALSVSAGVSELAAKTGLAETVRKISVWAMSLISTLFVGILGIQTTVNAAADNLTLKTARFILGTTVPVAGGALAEAVGTVASSISLLRSSLGIYGVVALAAIFLPVVAELLVWRAVLLVTSAIAEMFSLSKISVLLKAIDGTASVLVGILATVAAMFIISLTCVVAVK